MNSLESSRSLRFLSYILIVCLTLVSCTSAKLAELEISCKERYLIEKPFENSQFISIDGVRMHIRQWDSTTSITDKGIVYLLPGATGSTENWRYLVPVFCAYGWKVVCVDVPPFGFSGEKQEDSKRFDPLSEDTYTRARLLWNVFDSLFPEYKGKLLLGGHSHGGRIAAAMAMEKPQMVSHLLLFAPALYGVSTIPGIYKYEPYRSFAQHESRWLLERYFAVNTVMKEVYGRRVSEDEFSRNWAPFTRDGAKDAAVEWLSASVDPVPLPLEELNVPVLMFWAKNDKIVPNKGKKLEKTLPNAVYIPVKGSSHCIIETDTNTIIPHLIPLLSH